MIVLSLSYAENTLWAAGPEGLQRFDGKNWESVVQPQNQLRCCVALGEQVLVGGAPHGVAFSLEGGSRWKSAWMDGLVSQVLCLAADPQALHNGVVLAGTQNAGVLRSTDRGYSWGSCNFGLQDFSILALAWAPAAGEQIWPRWEVVFAATEQGVYRSPNGGLAWQKCDGPQDAVLSLGVATEFHSSGVVLAGSETEGLWRSQDGGKHFERVAQAPEQVNALLALQEGWVLSDESQLWLSVDGLAWQALPESQPALALIATPLGVWAGNEEGVFEVGVPERW
jgi:ligand-binding sensor domain-containing protein